ncbi:hypothetical protein BDV96DRAFT_646353 [Lophiotrema nucula]|uniref:Uncharacterized protein n=1 Tax=Lophiotrema nucula TaxID=690887 RepID=A0A6A5Z7S5_9PLEO|nr:hypothetical protein BDV96DRAFT_646353 [Lophiotrema nucula]
MALGLGPPAEQDSPLLCLPGELRNRICGFALTYSDGVYYVEGLDKPRFSRSPRAKRDVNQLKYVCRQLYGETKGFEISFSTVIFRKAYGKSAMPSALAMFLRFVDSIGTKWLISINAVVLKEPKILTDQENHRNARLGGGDVAQTARLLHLCNDNQQIAFEVDVRGFHGAEPMGLIYHGSYLDAVYRRDPSKDTLYDLFGPDIPEDVAEILEFMKAEFLYAPIDNDKERYGIEDCNLSNFKLKPQGTWDEATFRKKARSYLDGGLGLYDETELDLWVSYAEEWYKVGI